MFPKKVQSQIVDYCKSKGYLLSEVPDTFTIIYVEGINLDGSLNQDTPNHFNDIRSIFNHRLECLALWVATTEPGAKYTYNPVNPKGAARIQFGEHKAWQVGVHKNHEALIQVSSITVCRDLNKDFIRTGDAIEKGLFGVNQHWGYDLPVNNIGGASAGCLVGRTKEGHKEFMTLVKSDVRYRSDKKHIFSTIVIPADILILDVSHLQL